MADVLIVLLPGGPWLEVADELTADGYRVAILSDGEPAVAHCALAIARIADNRPLLLVAHGTTGALLPAVGFSQRAARRRVSGYVLIDAELPPPGMGDWPDAPVTYVGEAARAAALRGWDVLDVDATTAIRTAADRT